MSQLSCNIYIVNDQSKHITIIFGVTMTGKHNGIFFFRAHQWWNYALAPALGWVYFLLFLNTTDYRDALSQLLCIGLSFLGMAALGYFLNDWSDEASDKVANKHNITSSLSVLNKTIISILLFSIGLAPWLLFTKNNLFVFILLLETALILLYSFPPFRFKERGWVAPITDALYAHVLPSVLFLFLILSEVPPLFLFIVVAWKMLSGVRYYLNHIALDFHNDKLSGTKTLATQYGVLALYRWISKFIFPLEVLFVTALFLLSLSHTPYVIPVALFLLFGTIFIEQILTTTTTASFFVYNFSRITIDDFYQKVFPIASLIGLVYLDNKFFILLIGHLLLFHSLGYAIWLLVKGAFLVIYRLPYRKTVSLIINYTVYYFRKVVLCNNEQQARKNQYAEYAAYQSKLQSDLTKRKNGRVAVVNINQDKYTETFVKGMMHNLPFETHQLYGGSLPTFSLNEGDFISDNKLLKAWVRFVALLLGKSEDYFLKKSILNYLNRNEIDVVLAEFGPVGVSMSEICREAGIPLVVHFHGYDAYHSQVLQENREAYKQMFIYSSAIIAVSKEMKEQLIYLGADAHKVFYQPDFVDLSLYQHIDVSNNPPVCLAIGRFAETKSPHLTILAFYKVLAQIPEARLVMVGKDGGGELFEACHILVRALRISHAVDFKGILPPAQIYDLMKTSKVFVQHSLTTPLHGDKEGTPVAVMEASAAGLPVVATTHAGIKDVIIPNETGILVDEFDIEAMAEAMIELLQNDTKVKQMGQAGSAYIHQHPQIGHYTDHLEKILKSAIS